MLRSSADHEIEIKLRVSDVSALRSRLRGLRAREICPRTYESNTLYDTPDEDLRRRGQLIRLRVERPGSKRGPAHKHQETSALLTYKGRAQRTLAKRARVRNTRFKIREEAEVTISADRNAANKMIRILRALGLRPSFRYEKYRTTYTLPGIHDAKIEFDETPIGLFLELEGTVLAIDRAARALGYSKSDYISQSYGALWIANLRRRGLKPGDMLFRPRKTSN